jgi:hypothetical protein
MNWYLKRFIFLVGFLALLALVVYVKGLLPDPKADGLSVLQAQNALVAGYLETSEERLATSVITIPDMKDTLVGLVDGKGVFPLAPGSSAQGMVMLGTERAPVFVEGMLEGKTPRADVIAPLYINTGGSGTFIYVVLFQDRGDVALMKSYAFIGDRSEIEYIKTTTLEDGSPNEYLVHIGYLVRGDDEPMSATPTIAKETIIPVRDGLFVPEETVTK